MFPFEYPSLLLPQKHPKISCPLNFLLHPMCSGVSLQDRRFNLRGNYYSRSSEGNFQELFLSFYCGMWRSNLGMPGEQFSPASHPSCQPKFLLSVAAILILLPSVLVSVISTPRISHDYFICSEKNKLVIKVDAIFILIVADYISQR